MANVATTETFPKRAFTHADVEAERAARLQIPGVISSTITNAAADWLLTTIFPGPDSGASAPGPAAPAPPAMQGPAAPPHPVPPATPSAPAPRNAEAVFRRKVPGFMRRLMADFELRDFHAAGVFGNIGHECAGFTILHEIGQPEGKGGYGWAQWTGPRRVAFLKWCDDHGLRFTDDEANYGFLKHELDTSQSDAIAALLKTATLDGAVQAFERNFERAGVPNFPSRNHWAAIALDAFNAANA